MRPREVTDMASVGSTNFSGLASGLNTQEIIENLVKVDSQPLTRLQNQQTDLSKKKDTYASMNSSLLELKSRVSDLRTSSAFGAFSASSSEEEALTIKALSSANEGNYSVKILSLAEAKSLSGDSFAASDQALGLSGEIMINGRGLRIRSANTLTDIANSINSLDNGVSATVLKVSDSDSRLILTATAQGSEGFTLANAGSNDLLESLGLSDGAVQIRESADGMVYSSAFDSASSTIGSLSGLSGKADGTVRIRNQELGINLSTDTLSSLRDKINGLGLEGVTARIDTITESGQTRYRLAISGTEDFTDDGNVLESLGILEGGTSGVHASFRTSALTTDNSRKNESATRLTDLGAVEGETIVISGVTPDGASVREEMTIDKNTRVSDLLSRIENAFSGAVQARFEDGRIVIESTEGGETNLDVRLSAGNQKGGTIDFGSMETVTPGRERLLSTGKDAKLLVNNITVTRSSNEINDAISGLSLSLKKADPAEEIILTVTRDTDAIKTKIEAFVKAYNDLAAFVDENSAYDEETQVSGPLNGDLTSRSVVSRIRSIMQQTVSVDDSTITSLLQAGIEYTAKGRLEIDSSSLDKALETDLESLTSLFTVNRTSTNTSINFVYNSTKTVPGTYDVQITRAAEQAEVESQTSVAASAGNLTVTDNYGSSVTVEYEAGDHVADIANRLNVEARKTSVEIVQSSQGLEREDGTAITQDTVIGDIAGVEVESGDTITLTGTDRNGKQFQQRLRFTDGDSYTVQNVLTSIEKATNNTVSASIDSEGKILLQDRTAGASKLSLSISSSIEGLRFGTFEVIQEGRNAVAVEASGVGDRLTINHRSYGSASFMTVSGGDGLGIAGGEYRGVDVAGTINGKEGVGNGQTLTASGSDPSTQGIALQVNVTAEDLTAEGAGRGKITLVSGVADSLFRELTSLTDTVSGLVQTKIDSFDRSLGSLKETISNTEKRIAQRKTMYERKFTALEVALQRLQTLQERLSATLGSLG